MGLELGHGTLLSHSPKESQSAGKRCSEPVCSGARCVKRKFPSFHGGIVGPEQLCSGLPDLIWTVVQCLAGPRSVGDPVDRQEEEGSRGGREGCGLCPGAAVSAHEGHTLGECLLGRVPGHLKYQAGACSGLAWKAEGSMVSW